MSRIFCLTGNAAYEDSKKRWLCLFLLADANLVPIQIQSYTITQPEEAGESALGRTIDMLAAVTI